MAVAFAIGIALANFAARAPLRLWLMCAAAISLLTIGLAFYGRTQNHSRTISLCLLCASALLGAGAYRLEQAQAAGADTLRGFYERGAIAANDPLEMTGALAREPEPAPQGLYLTLNVENFIYKEQTYVVHNSVVQLFVPVRDERARTAYAELQLTYGARLRVACSPTRADEFRNPGVTPLTAYLDQRGFAASGIIKSPLLVERLEDRRVFAPLAYLYAWRQKLLAQMRALFAPETAGILQAALLGNRYFLEDATSERFRVGGTFHLLVISGQHITFLGLLAWLILRRVTRRRAAQFTLATLLIWGYALAVGAEASVVRAAVMFTFLALARIIGRKADNLNALGAAALLLLILEPRDLFDPSFQLTFLAVFLITAWAIPLWENLRAIGSWRLTATTPAPPRCGAFTKAFAESLFWSARAWRMEAERNVYSYRLWKSAWAERLEHWRIQRLWRWSFAALLVSACVTVGMLPLQIIYFHRVTPVALVLNLFAGLLMAALSLAALAALLLALIAAKIAAPLILLTETLAYLMTHAIDPFARRGIAAWRTAEYTGWKTSAYLLFALALANVIWRAQSWRPFVASNTLRSFENGANVALTHKANTFLAKPMHAVGALILCAALIIFHPLSAPRGDGKLRVDFLDVGQGDAALLTLPDGATVLIDGGGKNDFARAAENASSDSADQDAELFARDPHGIGERVVSEVLWARGLSKVDYLVATHADADHIGGLIDVAHNFRIGVIFVGRTPGDDPEFAELARTAWLYNVPVRVLAAGDELTLGGVEFEVLHPAPVAAGGANTQGNNESLVVRAQVGARVFLFTGDIEKEAESGLTRAWRDKLKSDVVKVAHHGSRTSSTPDFINAAAPRYAVISVGRFSPFGHPHPEVVMRWRESGATLWTTGECGMISFITDGNVLRAETFIAPEH